MRVLWGLLVMGNGNKKTQKNESQPKGISPRAVLVCGVDIEGSTELKINDPLGGKERISFFMKNFDNRLRNKDLKDGDDEKDGWFLWRVLGDELVYLRIVPEDKNGNLDSMYVKKYIMEFVQVAESIEFLTPSNEYPPSNSNVRFDTPLGIHGYAFLLHSKGEQWEFTWNLISKNWAKKSEMQIKLETGMQDPAVPPELLADEVFSKYGYNLREIQIDYFIDFLGRDVDLGFRIAGYSRPHQFMLSPKLASCLMRANDSSRKGGSKLEIYFLGLYELKGCAIGDRGPDRFPLFFIHIKNKDSSMQPEILRNYKKFNLKVARKNLNRFAKYENESCRLIGNKILENSHAITSENNRLNPDLDIEVDRNITLRGDV